MINPKITKKSGIFETEEGCLSLDGVRPCKRYKEIEVDYLDQDFKEQHGKYSDGQHRSYSMKLIIARDCDMIELQTMNEIPIIYDHKNRSRRSRNSNVNFYVKEDSMDEPEEISMEELTAYDRNLGIGDQVIIGPDETLFPLDMAENLGMFDEIDPLSQISETDPRHWQMEWMDNYMDALEELEDSTTRE